LIWCLAIKTTLDFLSGTEKEPESTGNRLAMGKSGRVRLRDVRQDFRLVGECRDLGAAAVAWRSHALEGMGRLAAHQFDFSETQDGEQVAADHIIARDVNRGCDHFPLIVTAHLRKDSTGEGKDFGEGKNTGVDAADSGAKRQEELVRAPCAIRVVARPESVDDGAALATTLRRRSRGGQ
jgi:hypothetical protein